MVNIGPRDVLNKLRWHPDLELKSAEITIEHRGAPRDRLTFSGEDIIDLGSGFMKVERGVEQVSIPYHRVRKIETPSEVLWEDR